MLTEDENMVPKARLDDTGCFSKPIKRSTANAWRPRTAVVTTVPMTPKVVTAPKLSKKCFFFMLKPAGKDS